MGGLKIASAKSIVSQTYSDLSLPEVSLPRTNPFVKDCEKSGYYFPAIVMKMVHKTEPYRIHLEVQFKFRPEMPEVNINDSFLIEKDGEKPFQLEPDFKKEELNIFKLKSKELSEIGAETICPQRINKYKNKTD